MESPFLDSTAESPLFELLAVYLRSASVIFLLAVKDERGGGVRRGREGATLVLASLVLVH